MYDLAGRVVSQREYAGTGTKSDTLKSSTDFTYASKTNYLTGVKHVSPLGTQTISYTYGNLSNGQMPDQVYSVKWNGTEKVKYTYDAFGRLTNKKIGTFNNTYTYYNFGTNRTTTLGMTVTTPAGKYSYTYDKTDKVASYSDGTNKSTYSYDALNQLVRENNQRRGKTYTYSYTNGNITERKEYAYTTGELGEVLATKKWSYGDTVWKDLLTNYNGEAITYDAIGNPTKIGTKTLKWNGRQLAEYANGSDKITYAYNGDGQRISKTVNGTKTEFYYNGSILAGQKTGSSTLIFMYDNNGDAFGFKYNGTEYFYVKNLQNDITAITDASGNVIANYYYDAWGNIIETTGDTSIANVNPLRYRSYYYDAENNLYYLNSRYYAPVMCRFLNADGQLNEKDGPLGYNMFAYCNNNPTNMSDSEGNMPFFAVTGIIGAVAGAVIGGVVAAKSGKNVWAGIGIGALAGGLIGMGVGAVASVLLTGAAASSTAAVATGAKLLCTTVSTVGVSAGFKMIADNASQSLNKSTSVFWSGGNLAKNAAKDVANKINGRTLEMTRLGMHLEKINAPYSAWQVASSNFANVAKNSQSVIYSIQNSSGVGLNSTWATIEYPLLNGCDITYGVVYQNGYIYIMY